MSSREEKLDDHAPDQLEAPETAVAAEDARWLNGVNRQLRDDAVRQCAAASKAAAGKRTTSCSELPFDAWDIIIQYFKQIHGLRAAKMLRKFARVSQYFAAEARHHPDNNVPSVRERVLPSVGLCMLDGERERVMSDARGRYLS